MSETEYPALRASIEELGRLEEPITLYEGMVLDGRNRLRACRELGITPAVTEWAGQGSPERYVISKNISRRHLTESQRALVAAGFATRPRGRPGKKAQDQAFSQDVAADIFGVSRSLIQDAKKVRKLGKEDLIDRVWRGALTVTEAARIAREGAATPRAIPAGERADRKPSRGPTGDGTAGVGDAPAAGSPSEADLTPGADAPAKGPRPARTDGDAAKAGRLNAVTEPAETEALTLEGDLAATSVRCECPATYHLIEAAELIVRYVDDALSEIGRGLDPATRERLDRCVSTMGTAADRVRQALNRHEEAGNPVDG
jgi:hypothetical protein